MAKYSLFDDFDGWAASHWTNVEEGAGSLTLSDSKMIQRTNGTAAADVAALVLKQPLTPTSIWHIALCFRRPSSNPAMGAWNPNIFGLVDSATEPGSMSEATWQSVRRWYTEDQYSESSFPTWARAQWRYENPSNTRFHWDSNNTEWTTTFQNTRLSWKPYYNDVFQTWIIQYDGPQNRIRFLACSKVATSYNGTPRFQNQRTGWRLVQDNVTAWRTFGTDIKAVSNQLWFVIGDLQNNVTNGKLDWGNDLEWCLVQELVGDDEEYGFSNYGFGYSGFPIDYDIGRLRCGSPKDAMFWLPEDSLLQTILSPGAADEQSWVKDPRPSVDDAANYHLFYSTRDTSGNGHIRVRSMPTGLGGSLGTPTTLLSATAISDGGDVGRLSNFPLAVYNENSVRWEMVFGLEFDSTPFRVAIYYSHNSSPDPTSEWTEPTKILDTQGSPQAWKKDGCGQPFVFKYGATFILFYSGYNVDTGGWQVGYATATSFEGPYTDQTTNPLFPLGIEEPITENSLSVAQTLTCPNAANFNVNEMVTVWGDTNNDNRKFCPFVITDISGTTVTLNTRASCDSGGNGITLSQLHAKAIALSAVVFRGVGKGWFFPCTMFKHGGAGEEMIGMVRSDADSPTDGPFVFNQEKLFPVAMPENYESYENIAFLAELEVEEPSLPISGTAGSLALPDSRPSLSAGLADRENARYPELWDNLKFWLDGTVGPHRVRSLVGPGVFTSLEPEWSTAGIDGDGGFDFAAGNKYIDVNGFDISPDKSYTILIEVTNGSVSGGNRWIMDMFTNAANWQYIDIADNGQTRWFDIIANNTMSSGFVMLPKDLRWTIVYRWERFPNGDYDKRIYINGEQKIGLTGNATLTSRTIGVWRIGARLSDINYWDGFLHRFGIWTRTLTDNEIRKLSVVYQPTS